LLGLFVRRGGYFSINHCKDYAVFLSNKRVELFYERPAFSSIMKYSTIIRQIYIFPNHIFIVDASKQRGA